MDGSLSPWWGLDNTLRPTRSRRQLIFGDPEPWRLPPLRTWLAACFLTVLATAACLGLSDALAWADAPAAAAGAAGEMLQPLGWGRRRRLIQAAVEGSQLELHQEQQPHPQLGGIATSGGSDGSWPPLRLAHNLSSPSPAGLFLFYQQQLGSLLDRTPQLLRWLQPGDRDRFCTACSGRPGAQVALVGDGPLSAEQRGCIARAHCVLQVGSGANKDRERDSDRTDAFFIRGPAEAKWASKAAQEAQVVVLVDGYGPDNNGGDWLRRWESDRAPAPADKRGFNVSRSASMKLLPLEAGPFVAAWKAIAARLGFSEGRSLPSTGLIAAFAALECLPLDGALHLYGFRWRELDGRLVEIEASLVGSLIRLESASGRNGRVVAHPPL